jgi:hypothetical protein
MPARDLAAVVMTARADELITVLGADVDVCDYCGKPGHAWPAHREARADVGAWQRHLAADV